MCASVDLSLKTPGTNTARGVQNEKRSVRSCFNLLEQLTEFCICRLGLRSKYRTKIAGGYLRLGLSPLPLDSTGLA